MDTHTYIQIKGTFVFLTEFWLNGSVWSKLKNIYMVSNYILNIKKNYKKFYKC